MNAQGWLQEGLVLQTVVIIPIPIPVGLMMAEAIQPQAGMFIPHLHQAEAPEAPRADLALAAALAEAVAAATVVPEAEDFNH